MTTQTLQNLFELTKQNNMTIYKTRKQSNYMSFVLVVLKANRQSWKSGIQKIHARIKHAANKIFENIIPVVKKILPTMKKKTAIYIGIFVEISMNHLFYLVHCSSSRFNVWRRSSINITLQVFLKKLSSARVTHLQGEIGVVCCKIFKTENTVSKFLIYGVLTCLAVSDNTIAFYIPKIIVSPIFVS
jgi:phage-related protein